MDTDPEGWISRIVGACVSLFVAALALYGAVWLVLCVWPVLAAIAAVVVVLALAVMAWRWSRARW